MGAISTVEAARCHSETARGVWRGRLANSETELEGSKGIYTSASIIVTFHVAGTAVMTLVAGTRQPPASPSTGRRAGAGAPPTTRKRNQCCSFTIGADAVILQLAQMLLCWSCCGNNSLPRAVPPGPPLRRLTACSTARLSPPHEHTESRDFDRIEIELSDAIRNRAITVRTWTWREKAGSALGSESAATADG
jgi:hypothetical protein